MGQMTTLAASGGFLVIIALALELFQGALRLTEKEAEVMQLFSFNLLINFCHPIVLRNPIGKTTR